MYSWELDSYLNNRKFYLTHDEFNYLRETSPQISYLKFENQGEVYSRYSIGTSDNYNFSIFVRNYNK
jgi:hypothetical protein